MNMTVLAGGGQAPDINVRPRLTALHTHKPALTQFPQSGEFVVCICCSHPFDEKGSSQDCPMCGAGAHWLEEHHTESERDRRASEIDPAEVAEQVAYRRRFVADRERRRKAEGSAA